MNGKAVKIAICDDDSFAVEELKEKIEKYLKEHGKSAEISTFLNGESLINQASGHDIIFLDIEMPGMNGLEVGKIIRSENEKCRIIMATAMEGKMKESFKINAFRFIVKPYSYGEITEALDAVWATYIGNEMVELYENRNLFAVAQRDIVYFHAYNSYVEAVTGGRVMRKDVTLKQVEACLDKRLFYCISRQYIVNMRFVEFSGDGYVQMKGVNYKTEKIKISRVNKKGFEKSYMEYDLRYRG